VDLSSCLVHGIRKGIAASFQAVEGLWAPALDLICISGTADRQDSISAVLLTERISRTACCQTRKMLAEYFRSQGRVFNLTENSWKVPERLHDSSHDVIDDIRENTRLHAPLTRRDAVGPFERNVTLWRADRYLTAGHARG
jgi:hypothetical protein